MFIPGHFGCHLVRNGEKPLCLGHRQPGLEGSKKPVAWYSWSPAFEADTFQRCKLILLVRLPEFDRKLKHVKCNDESLTEDFSHQDFFCSFSWNSPYHWDNCAFLHLVFYRKVDEQLQNDVAKNAVDWWNQDEYAESMQICRNLLKIRGGQPTGSLEWDVGGPCFIKI